MEKQLSGSCLCGGVAFSVTGSMGEFFLCHCSRCQKSSGSAHTSNLLVHDATLTWVHGELNVKTFTLPGTLYGRCFCTDCGSPLPAYEGDLLVVPAGSVESELGVVPSAHIFVASKACWDEHLELVKRYDELPG